MSKTEYLKTNLNRYTILDEINRNMFKISKSSCLSFIGMDHSKDKQKRELGKSKKAIILLNSVLWNTNIIHKIKRLIHNAIV